MIHDCDSLICPRPSRFVRHQRVRHAIGASVLGRSSLPTGASASSMCLPASATSLPLARQLPMGLVGSVAPQFLRCPEPREVHLIGGSTNQPQEKNEADPDPVSASRFCATALRLPTPFGQSDASASSARIPQVKSHADRRAKWGIDVITPFALLAHSARSYLCKTVCPHIA